MMIVARMSALFSPPPTRTRAHDDVPDYVCLLHVENVSVSMNEFALSFDRPLRATNLVR